MANPSTMTADIDVDAPIQAVYNQWTQFESFPQFLHAVKEVTQTDDARTHWVVSVGPVRREFDAEITEQVPDELIAWASIDGKSHSGSVRFSPAGGAITHVALEMMWLPETFVEKIGAAANIEAFTARTRPTPPRGACSPSSPLPASCSTVATDGPYQKQLSCMPYKQHARLQALDLWGSLSPDPLHGLEREIFNSMLANW